MTDTVALRRCGAFSASIAALAFVAATSPALATGDVNIYSYREPKLIEPLLKAFTDKTGIKTNVVFASSGLIERLTAEGANSPADVVLTNDSGLLFQAVAAKVTQPIKSDIIDKAVPAALRDPDQQWVGLTQRARIAYVSKDRVTQPTLTYEELADPKWKGKICIRSGQHTYNVALVASMIANLGEEKAEAWLSGLKANLARKPAGGDREAVRDVAAGQCDIAIGNTYYMAAMLANPEQKPWADAVRLMFPNAAGRGTHSNISGVVMAANAPNKASAMALLEFLVSPEAQALYASANGEYPVRADVKVPDVVAGWGTFKADPLSQAEIAKLRKKASELVEKVKFDQGPNS
jgi:iron(III) transport system substrate-binding protein